MEVKNAIISVSDKTGIVEFAKKLRELNVVIYSTGGTYKHLIDAKINVRKIQELTKFPEIMDGRVKTLHPYIYGGILGKRENEKHVNTIARYSIPWIDLVVVNLYPFEEVIKKEDTDLDTALENIDIGGVTLLRAAAKNFKDVVVLNELAQYQHVINELKQTGKVSLENRQLFAFAAFAYTSHYDSTIYSYLEESYYKGYKIEEVSWQKL